MHYVYILRSLKAKDRFYVGLTNNLERRLKEHEDPVIDQYTYRYYPWKVETYVVFQDHSTAPLQQHLKESHKVLNNLPRPFSRKRFFCTRQGQSSTFDIVKCRALTP